MAKVPMIRTYDGTQGDDDTYTYIPTEANAGLGICKDPTAGSFIALTAYAPGLGYLVGKDTEGVKRRILMTDHPAGGQSLTIDKDEGMEESVPTLQDVLKGFGIKLEYQVNPDGTRIDYEEEDD